MRIYILKIERKWLRGNTYRTYSITSPLLETDTRRKKVKKISLQVLLLEGGEGRSVDIYIFRPKTQLN